MLSENVHLLFVCGIVPPVTMCPALLCPCSLQVLGHVQPGGSLPLPQDWRADNKQLQIRPVLQEQQQAGRLPASPSRSPSQTVSTDLPSHAWSYGVSGGQQSVLLPSMEDGASRLLCCPTLGVQKAPDEPASTQEASAGGAISPRRAAAAAPACWFTTVCEATELSLQVSVEVSLKSSPSSYVS